MIDNLFIVVVLYNPLADSPWLNCLKKLVNKHSLLEVLIYDNSTENHNQKLIDDLSGVNYFHNPDNPGLAVAYNDALNRAGLLKKKWLLLLDQDSFYEEDFLETLNNLTQHLNSNAVGFLPRVLSRENNRLISPSIISLGGIVRAYKNLKEGYLSGSVTGINSGAILSVAYLKKIGGFNLNYPLDMLDHWYFREIRRAKLKLIHFPGKIYHSLSVWSFEENVSIKRYISILNSENRYHKANMFDYIFYKIRLIFRLIVQLSYKDKSYFKLTLRSILFLPV